MPSPDDTLNPLQFKTFIWNIFLTVLPIAILVSFAISKDISAGAIFNWPTVGLFILGMIIGVIITLTITTIILLAYRIYHQRHGATKFMLDKPIFILPTSKQEASLLRYIWFPFMILGLLPLLLIGLLGGMSEFLVAPILTFVLVLWVLPTVTLWARSFTKYVSANPQKPYYALARMGVLIFVISKIVVIVL